MLGTKLIIQQICHNRLTVVDITPAPTLNYSTIILRDDPINPLDPQTSGFYHVSRELALFRRSELLGECTK